MNDEKAPDSGASDQGGNGPSDEVPNPETGVGIGMMDEPTSFEPEEDPDAAATGDQSDSGS
jgi:hypothetical protein